MLVCPLSRGLVFRIFWGGVEGQPGLCFKASRYTVLVLGMWGRVVGTVFVSLNCVPTRLGCQAWFGVWNIEF